MSGSEDGSAPDDEASESIDPGQPTDRFHLEPRCRVCRNDAVRTMVNDLLACGVSYAQILRTLEEVNAAVEVRDRVTVDSIRNHSRRHFPVQNVAKSTYREILERRAKENGIDFENGVATAITPLAYLETVMVRGYMNLVGDSATVSYRDGMAAALRLSEMLRSQEPELERARVLAEMGRIIEVVRTFIPAEQWPQVQAMLRGEAPVVQQQSSPATVIRMVEIDDMRDDGDG